MVCAGAAGASAFAQPPGVAGQPVAKQEAVAWKGAEAPLLRNSVQLTTRDRFVKAGENYFSPDGKWVIFQAVPVPDKGQEAQPFYAMYVAKLTWADGKITGTEEPLSISPPGSANTCGWFHPTEKTRVLYGSTLGPPGETQPSGFQVGTRNYRWQFPREMEVVSQTVRPMAKDYGLKPGSDCGTDFLATPVFSRDGYDAECSYSGDGRYILYTHVDDPPMVDSKPGKADGDLWIFDTKTKKHVHIVQAPGYDGGPFFSPDSKRICYRSDRAGNDLLQVYTADVTFDKDGTPTGIANERNLTHNEHVNWAPYWHPSGKFLVYGTSEVGHQNYEVFAIEVSPEPGTDAKRRRVTFAPGADVLPVFSNDGKWMLWTSQRGPKVEGEERPSSQLWVAEWAGGVEFPEAGK